MQSDNTSVDEDQGLSLWIVNSIFVVLATLAVIARFTARRLKNLVLAADDWAIFVAMVCGRIPCLVQRLTAAQLLDWVLYGLFVACK
jgi:type III secretory pathway component EscS